MCRKETINSASYFDTIENATSGRCIRMILLKRIEQAETFLQVTNVNK